MTRIIAGARKGHRLRTPDHAHTRPTTDRVREAAFSAIVDWVGTTGEDPALSLEGIALLDLYAGSGAVALEAASRGASPTVAVEARSSVAGIIKANASALKLSTAVVTAPVEKWLATVTPQRFDVVWADPPYDLPTADVEQVLAALIDAGWLAESALLVLERSSRDEAPVMPPAVTQTWTRRYGETIVYFATKDAMC